MACDRHLKLGDCKDNSSDENDERLAVSIELVRFGAPNIFPGGSIEEECWIRLDCTFTRSALCSERLRVRALGPCFVRLLIFVHSEPREKRERRKVCALLLLLSYHGSTDDWALKWRQWRQSQWCKAAHVACLCVMQRTMHRYTSIGWAKPFI